MSIQIIEDHYRNHRGKLLKRMMFRAATPEDAEDIVQEAYTRALRYFNSYNGEIFERWLNTIANNCLKEMRTVQMGHAADEFIEEEADGTSCPSYPNHVMREVFELIDTKAPVQQDVLNLYFKYEYSAIDISRVTEYSYAQCHKIIQRFKIELEHLYK